MTLAWLRAACALLLLLSASVFAAEAPYVAARVAGSEQVERLPLKLTEVHAEILGPIADVRIRQTFENRGAVPIEALYVFPAPARAAVYAMTLQVGTRRVRAQIEEKQLAEQRYRTAVAAGKTASLLESVDEHLFKMRVGNVLPGEQVAVELQYTELLVPERGLYELVVPNTIGERYVQAGSHDASGPTTRAAEVIDYAFNFTAGLRLPVPLAELRSPSHQIEVLRRGPGDAQVLLAGDSLRTAAGKDLRLQFRLQGGAIQSGLSLYPAPDGGGGWFLLQVEPPARIEAAAVPPREFIFVVDVSGSMAGQPLDIAKALMRELFGTLGAQDHFNLLLFSGGSTLLSPTSRPADAATLADAEALLDKFEAGGGTELVEAMKIAMAIPRVGVARSIVVITDGAISADAELMQAIRAGLGQASVFALGVGPSVQRDVIERTARAGAGEPFIVDDLAEGNAVATRLRSYIDRPLLSGVSVAGEGFAIRELNPDPVPDLLAERPLVVAGRYSGPVTGAIVVRGRSGAGAFEQRIEVAGATHLPQGQGLRYLWARRQLAVLQDDYAAAPYSRTEAERVAQQQRIVALGLEHVLLTPFTSFVAVDEQVRTGTAAEAVQQPAVATAATPVADAEPEFLYSLGDALAGSRLLQVQVAVALAAGPPVAGCADARQLSGRRYCRRDGAWVDMALAADAPRLRLRRGSAALRQLLQAHPEFAAALALGERVVLQLGAWAIEVGPDGFGDVPEALWQRIEASVGVPPR